MLQTGDRSHWMRPQHISSSTSSTMRLYMVGRRIDRLKQQSARSALDETTVRRDLHHVESTGEGMQPLLRTGLRGPRALERFGGKGGTTLPARTGRLLSHLRRGGR
ncbi:hypothetical protein PoB_001478600 [Plakobranchus ocellatus]|uniref:Uncharacterized protein n=1 Tax=Plakobranchus ocellatus TaxID=259542 RepID=A0AAV3YLZ9_9GAST|nr:hypothetical protein PoB_001478600 [Plakobranchus ocellatus]